MVSDMVTLNHDDMQELIASHALGILEPNDAALVESHLPTCADCRAALADYMGVVEAIGYYTEPLPVPQGSRERFMDAVRAEPVVAPTLVAAQPALAPVIALAQRRAARQPVNIWQRFGTLAAIAAMFFLVSTIALGAYALTLNGQVTDLKTQTAQSQTTIGTLSAQVTALQDQVTQIKTAADQGQTTVSLLAAPRTQVKDLIGTADAPAATARIILNTQSNQAVFVPVNLAKLPSGKQYELWLIKDKTAVPVGLVTANADAVPLTLTGANLAQYPTFGVSIEPQGGSTTPTGTIVILGQTA